MLKHFTNVNVFHVAFYTTPASRCETLPDAHWRVKRRLAADDVVIAATTDPTHVTVPRPSTRLADPRPPGRGTG